MALMTRARGSVHEQWQPERRRATEPRDARRLSAKRRAAEMAPFVRAGLTSAQAYRLVYTVALFDQVERAR